MIDKIAIDGPLRVGDGYSQITRGLIWAFTHLGVQVHSANNWGALQDPEPEIFEAIARGFGSCDFGIRLSQPDSAGACPGRVKAVYSMWEFDEMPRARWRDNHDGTFRPVTPWGEGANDADIVLVPCEHSRQLFLDAGVTRPVHVVPLGYRPDYYEPKPSAKLRPFTYVIAGTLSGRKNPNMVYQVFRDLFGDREDVLLVMKSCAHLPLRLEPRGNIQIINEDWQHAQICDLYNRADVFVNPSQGEGFGLTNIEAMAAGLPVIATAWSAPLDYLDESVGWPLAWTMQEVGSDFCLSDPPADEPEGVFQTFRYAQPDEGALAEAMLDAFDDQEATRDKGRAAWERAQGYTWEHTAIKISEILEDHRG